MPTCFSHVAISTALQMGKPSSGQLTRLASGRGAERARTPARAAKPGFGPRGLLCRDPAPRSVCHTRGASGAPSPTETPRMPTPAEETERRNFSFSWLKPAMGRAKGNPCKVNKHLAEKEQALSGSRRHRVTCGQQTAVK